MIIRFASRVSGKLLTGRLRAKQLGRRKVPVLYAVRICAGAFAGRAKREEKGYLVRAVRYPARVSQRGNGESRNRKAANRSAKARKLRAP